MSTGGMKPFLRGEGTLPKSSGYLVPPCLLDFLHSS